MKFELVDNDRGTHDLQITTESPAEVRELIAHYKLDPFEYVNEATTGEMIYLDRALKRDNGSWFECSSFVDASWLQPYLDKLGWTTGYAGPLPSIENAPRYGSNYLVNLCHTHIVTAARITPDGMVFDGYDSAQDWDGKTADVLAPRYFAEYVREGIGDRKCEPEFIEMRNGLLKRNPNYKKRHAPHPAAKSARLFGCLFDWWRANHATPGQEEVLRRVEATHKSASKLETLAEMLMRGYSGGFYTHWGEGGFVKFEEFQKL